MTDKLQLQHRELSKYYKYLNAAKILQRQPCFLFFIFYSQLKCSQETQMTSESFVLHSWVSLCNKELDKINKMLRRKQGGNSHSATAAISLGSMSSLYCCIKTRRNSSEKNKNTQKWQKHGLIKNQTNISMRTFSVLDDRLMVVKHRKNSCRLPSHSLCDTGRSHELWVMNESGSSRESLVVSHEWVRE